MLRRLVLIGDGVIYRYNNEYYVSGSANLDILNIFEQISSVVIWSRIYDIGEGETKQYTKYDFSQVKVPVTVTGIYNQKPGARGYIFTLWKRIKSLDEIFDAPCMVYSSMISVTQWLMFLLYRRDIVYITRTIGDQACIADSKYWYARIGGKIAVYLSGKHYKKAVLQTWVSKPLEQKYAIKTIPSVVFNDCQISLNDVIENAASRDSQEFNLIFVGRLSPEKGILDLLKAILKINDCRIHLRIVGEGRDRESIISFVEKNNMKKNVELRGVKKWGEELFSEMKWAHCLVLPSYNEGLGMVCVEAMACGIPVIASNVGGIPELIKSNYNGLLVSPGNIEELRKAILCLVENESLRLDLATNAIEVAKQNTRESQLALFKEAYEKYVYGKC